MKSEDITAIATTTNAITLIVGTVFYIQGELNKKRFNEFGNQQKKAAAFAFAGDTYKGLCIEKLDKDDLDFAQKHLRILSGLYGL